MPSSRIIAALLIPRFAVEAERQRRPDIAARLILLGESTVFDCSLGAEASGVRRGLRLSEAIGLCHRAVVLPPDTSYYERRFEEILDALQELSPEVQRIELGAACVALEGLPVTAPAFCQEVIAGLHRRFGFLASAGVAGGKFPAQVAASVARPGSSIILEPGGEREFLGPLSIDHLPMTDAMRWRLGLLGLTTIGEIAAMPLGAFQAQFGPEGKRCWELAQGIDDEPLLPRLKEETIVRRLEMPAPAATLEAILIGVERLVYAAYSDNGRGRPDGPSGTARLGGRWVRKVIVRASLACPGGTSRNGGGSWEIAVPFREALSDPRDAWFAVKNAIVRRPPERPVEELEVELIGLTTESGKQAMMFEGKGKLWRQVEEAVRQMGAQHGRPAMGKVIPVEPWSRIPERRAALAELDM